MVALIIIVLCATERTKITNYRNKKLSYRRETARQLHTSFLAHSLIVHFTEHRICFTTITGCAVAAALL